MNVVYSSIHPNFQRKTLLRGCLSTFPGFIFLLFLGVYGTPVFLEIWWLLIFGIGIGAAAWGLISYRRLSRLKTHPHRIIVEKNKWQVITSKQRIAFLPEEIQSIYYIQKKNRYGIEINLKEEKLFFPFFSRSAYTRLHDIMHTNESDESPLI